MKVRIRDHRLHAWPKLHRKDERIYVSFRALSSLALSNAHNLILSPLESIWRFCFGILVVDFVFFLCTNLTFFGNFPATRTVVYWSMAFLFCYWQIERVCSYPGCHFLFSRLHRLIISRDYVWAGRFFLKPYPRTVHTRFALRPIKSNSNDAAYREVSKLILVIDASRKIAIAELSDPTKADRIIENLTTAMELSDDESEYDIDPRRSI